MLFNQIEKVIHQLFPWKRVRPGAHPSVTDDLPSYPKVIFWFEKDVDFGQRFNFSSKLSSGYSIQEFLALESMYSYIRQYRHYFNPYF